MDQFQVLKRALHLPSLLQGTATVLMGTAAAAIRTKVEFLPFILTLCFVWLAQITSNTAYSLRELKAHYGSSIIDQAKGVMVSREDLTTYTMLRETSISAGVLTASIGVVLIGNSGFWICLLGAITLILSYLNLQGPTPLVRTPFGPLVTFLLFGPIGVLGTVLIQGDDSMMTFFSWFDMAPPLFLGVATGFLATNDHIATAYLDYRYDVLTRRTTIVTAYGRKVARIIYLVNGWAMWLTFYFMITTTYVRHPWVAFIMPTIAFAANGAIFHQLSKTTGEQHRWNPYIFSLLNLFVLAFFTFLLALYLGVPSDAIREYF